MQKVHFYLVIGILLAFSSCSETDSENTPKENGYHLIVRASYADFLFKLNNYHLDKSLKETILKSEKRHIETDEDFWKCLKIELSENTDGYNFYDLIEYAQNRNELSRKDNEELISALSGIFDMDFENSMLISEARLEKSGATHIDVKRLRPDKFEVIAYNVKDKDRFAKLIQSNANVGFFETMENITALNEILRFTKKVYERDSIAGIPFADSYLEGKPNSFFPRGFMFNLIMNNGQYSMPDGAIVGMAKWGDTSYFNQFSRDTIVTSGLPKLVHFLWGMKEDENGFPLYTIQSNNLNQPYLSGEEIVDAIVKTENGSAQVEIRFNSMGTEKFRKMTLRNLNKAIAIVMDGKVLSAPIVQQEISGGAAVISGNFTVEEAQDLANILKAGLMPMRLEVVEMEKIK